MHSGQKPSSVRKSYNAANFSSDIEPPCTFELLLSSMCFSVLIFYLLHLYYRLRLFASHAAMACDMGSPVSSSTQSHWPFGLHSRKTYSPDGVTMKSKQPKFSPILCRYSRHLHEILFGNSYCDHPMPLPYPCRQSIFPVSSCCDWESILQEKTLSPTTVTLSSNAFSIYSWTKLTVWENASAGAFDMSCNVVFCVMNSHSDSSLSSHIREDSIGFNANTAALPILLTI